MRQIAVLIFLTTLGATYATLAQVPPSCALVPKPPWPVVLNEYGGRVEPELKASDDGLTTYVEDFVPAPWPKCWVRGYVPYTKIVKAPDLPSVHEPVIWPPELQAKWEASVANRL